MYYPDTIHPQTKAMGLSCVVTCKGFSNEAAKKMAEELNIKAIRLSDTGY